LSTRFTTMPCAARQYVYLRRRVPEQGSVSRIALHSKNLQLYIQYKVHYARKAVCHWHVTIVVSVSWGHISDLHSLLVPRQAIIKHSNSTHPLPNSGAWSTIHQCFVPEKSCHAPSRTPHSPLSCIAFLSTPVTVSRTQRCVKRTISACERHPMVRHKNNMEARGSLPYRDEAVA
jgi:hypothetical protein